MLPLCTSTHLSLNIYFKHQTTIILQAFKVFPHKNCSRENKKTTLVNPTSDPPIHWPLGWKNIRSDQFKRIYISIMMHALKSVQNVGNKMHEKTPGLNF